jgi:hypothetical protein
MPSIVQPSADFISVLEALYRPEPDMTRWASEFLAEIGGVVAASYALATMATGRWPASLRWPWWTPHRTRAQT